MGFQAPRRTYSLEFEGEDFDGLVVKVRPPTVGEALANFDLSWMQAEDISEKERLGRLRDLYELFVSRLVSWNLEVDGELVPTTIDGLLSLDNDFGIRIVRSWLFETSAVPRPLAESSPAGEVPEDLSLPMETLSTSLAS